MRALGQAPLIRCKNERGIQMDELNNVPVQSEDVGTRILNILLMLSEKVDNLETGQKALMDEVLNPLRAGVEEQKFQDFKEKYSDQLGPYENLLKMTEDKGEDFDVYRDTYDKYKDLPEDEMNQSVENLSDLLAEKFDNLREQLGINPEADIEIKSDAEGQTEVEIKEDEASESTEVPSEVPAEPSEVTEETKEITEEAVPEDEENYDDSEMIEELRKEKAKYSNI